MNKLAVGLLGPLILLTNGCGTRDAGKEGQLVLHGNVDIRQISLAFEESGRIAQLRAEEGDSVKAGAVLATLDTVSLQLQAAQADAQIGVQKENLRKLQNGSRPEEIAQAQARFDAASADAARARDDLARLQGISMRTDGRGVSAQDLDHAKKEAAVAQAKAREQGEALRLARIGPRREDIAGGQAQLTAAEAQAALLHHQVKQGELRAPADGIVRSRLLEPGDMASPQRPVFSIALAHPKWIRVYVNEMDLGNIKTGLSASISTDSQPDQPVVGRVGYISSVAEFTPKSVETEELRTSLVYEVRVLVEDKGNRLRLGQPVTVRISIGAGR